MAGINWREAMAKYSSVGIALVNRGYRMRGGEGPFVHAGEVHEAEGLQFSLKPGDQLDLYLQVVPHPATVLSFFCSNNDEVDRLLVDGDQRKLEIAQSFGVHVF